MHLLSSSVQSVDNILSIEKQDMKCSACNNGRLEQIELEAGLFANQFWLVGQMLNVFRRLL